MGLSFCKECGGDDASPNSSKASAYAGMMSSDEYEAYLKATGEGNTQKKDSRRTQQFKLQGASLFNRREALKRSDSEQNRLKKDKIDMHARILGRHGLASGDYDDDHIERAVGLHSDLEDSERHLSLSHDHDNDNDNDNEQEAAPAGGLTAKTPAEVKFIDDSLTDCDDSFIFSSLSQEERHKFIHAMELVNFMPNDIIIRQGDVGDYFYVVKDGKVSIYVGNKNGESTPQDRPPSAAAAATNVIIQSLIPENSKRDVGLGGTHQDLFVPPEIAGTPRQLHKQQQQHQQQQQQHQPQQQQQQNDGNGKEESTWTETLTSMAKYVIWGSPTTTANEGQAQQEGNTKSDNDEDISNGNNSDQGKGGGGGGAGVSHHQHHHRAPRRVSNIVPAKVSTNKATTKRTMKSVIVPTTTRKKKKGQIDDDDDDDDGDSDEPFQPQNNTHVGDFGPGDTFGELALLYNCPRMATCVAQTPCSLWRVNTQTFRKLISGKRSPNKHQCQMALETLRKIDFFTDLDDMALTRIVNALIPVSFEKGEHIFTKGDVGDTFHIVMSGEVKIHDIGHGDSQFCDVRAGPGDWFGERALLTGEPRAANVTAESDTVVTLALSREGFEEKLGRLQDLLDVASRKKQLTSIPSFARSGFTSLELDALAKLPKKVVFEPGQMVQITGPSATPALYLIQSGKMQITDEIKNTVNIFRGGDHFGGEMLLSDDSAQEWANGKEVEAIERTECAMLTRDAIESVIGNISRLGKPLPNRFAKLDTSIQLTDLKKHRILGVGSFGRVWLVEHKKHGDVYALKIMEKEEIIEHGAENFVLREKNIMASIDHPFIIDLVSVFQDTHSLYMLESFIQGGELFTVVHTQKSNGVSNDAARFYAACVWESLSHLHQRNICYRDLKPENVLIDANGYCVLIDLGFAKVVLDKTYTKCGTPEYFAPELVLGRGHSVEVDNWAFGVVVYEMIVGQSPFSHRNATPLSLFRRIVQGQYAFPNKEQHGIYVSADAQDLIQRFLTSKPEDRLGSGDNGDDAVRNHPWFEGILQGNVLLKRQVTAPWVPEIENPMDASHFDSYFDIEHQEKRRRHGKLSAGDQALFSEF